MLNSLFTGEKGAGVSKTILSTKAKLAVIRGGTHRTSVSSLEESSTAFCLHYDVQCAYSSYQGCGRRNGIHLQE